MAESCFITNRRDLLIGMGGTVAAGALSGGVLLSSALAAEFDPAWRAYLKAQAGEDAVNNHRGPEDDYYEGLFDVYIAAERKLAATPSASIHGICGKMRRFVINEHWDDKDDTLAVVLGRSILADLERMTGVDHAKKSKSMPNTLHPSPRT